MLNYHEGHQNEADNQYVHSNSIADEWVDSEGLDQTHTDALEDYLDRVCAPLVGKIPRSNRKEIRERVRQRLEQFAAAHRELGSTPDEAVELAMAQCGDPAQISSRWLPERNTVQQGRVTTGIKTLRLSDRLLGSAKASTVISTLTFGLPYLAYITGTSDKWWTTYSDNWVPYYRIFMFAVPLLAGLVAGIAAKHKPVRGVANAIGLLTIPALVFPGLLIGMAYSHVLINQQSNLPFLPNPIPAMCGLVPWLTMGCFGAGLGRRIRAAGARIATRTSRTMRYSGSNGGSLRDDIDNLLSEPPLETRTVC